jgi:uncharacterized membrane protein YphA (DoxX/SURF4 family)
MKYVLWFLRIAIGLLFIFSGLVKANDPLGLTYKMDEVFDVWHIDIFQHYTLAFSLIMIALEIVCGVAMIVGSAFRFFIVVMLLLNIFYTFLTGYALVTDNIKECGCFGDCFKLSNMATFLKDVVLLAVSLFLFIFRNRVVPLFKAYVNTSIMILSSFLSFGIQWWALEHLPFHDCLPYKPGNNLWQKMQAAPDATPPVMETTLIYEKNGVKKEFNEKNLPWQDTTWHFVDQKVKVISEGTGQPEIPHDFAFNDLNGNDSTEAILTAKGYRFILFVREDFNKANMERITSLMNDCAKQNVPFVLAWSADKSELADFQKSYGVQNAPVYLMDGTVSKTALRSNPGLMLLHDGVVDHKWSYRDYPAGFSMNSGKLQAK